MVGQVHFERVKRLPCGDFFRMNGGVQTTAGSISVCHDGLQGVPRLTSALPLPPSTAKMKDQAFLCFGSFHHGDVTRFTDSLIEESVNLVLGLLDP
jgi:hypothetical protein